MKKPAVRKQEPSVAEHTKRWLESTADWLEDASYDNNKPSPASEEGRKLAVNYIRLGARG